MNQKNQTNAYAIVKRRYITEKSTVLSSLKDAKSNASLRRCESPKYVFLVDPTANKSQIANAIEEIYKARGVKVRAVNTIIVKPKHYNQRGSRNAGRSTLIKKAIVTLANGNSLED